MKRLTFAVFILGLLTAADGAVIDRQWDPHSAHFIAIESLYTGFYTGPLGQEFTPAMDNIVGVEIGFGRAINIVPPAQPAPITVKIMNDVITGNVIASCTITPADPQPGWLYFDFGGQIPLTVGNRYVINVSASQPCELGWLYVGGSNEPIPGFSIFGGQRSSIDDGAFVFRTYAAPEPATLLLLGLGGLILRKRS